MAAPGPIPALPDSERRTQYTISGSTGPLNVGFALYGDSTDFGNWVEVYVNSVQLPANAFTVTSPTTTLATGARPITDAQVTFNVAQTGLVQIVGAQRPRRLAQLSENQGVSAHDFNQLFTAIIAMIREAWDLRNRTLRVPGGEALPMLQPAASRANQNAIFDSQGNLTAGLPVAGAIPVSAAMQPVVAAATISAALALLGISASSATIGTFATRATAAAATIPNTTQFVQTAGFATVGDGGQALYSLGSVSTPGGFQSADGAWWVLSDEIIDPRMCGAQFRGLTDDGAAINTAISIGRPVRCPPGVALSSVNITLNQSIKFEGAGWKTTEFRFTGPSVGIIISASNVEARDFFVTSTIVAASRTVAGVKITGNLVECTFVQSNGHLYGFWNQGQANEWQHCFAQTNASHGFFIDGSVLAQNEIGIYECQGNGNGGDGFNFTGPGQGLRGTSLTAASNTGSGINQLNNMNSTYLSVIEISSNHQGGYIVATCSDVQIDNIFVEASVAFPNLQVLNSSMINVSNIFSQGARDPVSGHDIYVSSVDVTISCANLQSSHGYGIRIGALCAGFVATGVVIDNASATGFTHTGCLQIETTSPIVFVGCNVAGSIAVTGSVPAGSRIIAVGMTSVNDIPSRQAPHCQWIGIVGVAGADRDGPDLHVTVKDVPAFLAGIGRASAGEFGHRSARQLSRFRLSQFCHNIQIDVIQIEFSFIDFFRTEYDQRGFIRGNLEAALCCLGVHFWCPRVNYITPMLHHVTMGRDIFHNARKFGRVYSDTFNGVGGILSNSARSGALEQH